MDCFLFLMCYCGMTPAAIGFQLKCFTRAAEGVCGFIDFYPSNLESTEERGRLNFSPFFLFPNVLAGLFLKYDVCTALEIISMPCNIWNGYSYKWNIVTFIVYDYKSLTLNVLGCLDGCWKVSSPRTVDEEILAPSLKLYHLLDTSYKLEISGLWDSYRMRKVKPTTRAPLFVLLVFGFAPVIVAL